MNRFQRILIVLVVTTVSSFLKEAVAFSVPSENVRIHGFQHRQSILQMSNEEISDTPLPKSPPVKCPDCDLCDGSGRYVLNSKNPHYEKVCPFPPADKAHLFLFFLLLLSVRIEGGIGVVLTWWPIKAYRPCPNFIERGGVYQRSGQPLDEIAFGRDSTFQIDK